jgi:hypothetical protein
MEHKLLVLYAMHGLGPATAEQLLRFFVDRDQMNYIDLQLSLAELRESGLLNRYNHPLGVLYQPSVEGIETLRMFRNRIPYSSRHSVDDALMGWRARFTHERHVLHHVSKLPDGALEVRLSIMEEDELLMEIAVRAPDDERAERFCDEWTKKAGAMYAKILRVLNDPSEEP